MRPNQKKRELASWIRRQLGEPVIDVLIDPIQIDDAIDNAIDFFGEHAGGIGHEESLLVITPEQVKYDATGNPSQPKPKTGRWRGQPPQNLITDGDPANLNLNKFVSNDVSCLYEGSFATPCSSGAPTTGSPSCPSVTSNPPSGDCPATLDCGSIPASNTTDPNVQYGGPDGNIKTDFQIDPNCCPKEVQGPGPGWCGTNCQEPHCFTETEFCDQNAQGPFWIEGDNTSSPVVDTSKENYVFKSVYDIPKDVVGVVEGLPRGYGNAGAGGFSTQGEALFSPIHLFLNNGGLGLGGGIHGGMDMVGLELGLQYIEMFRRMYTIEYSVQLLDLQSKLRISPAPSSAGVIGVWVYRKVPEQYMYSHQWVRAYATALAMIQVGRNAVKYQGASFPGGASVNAMYYIDEGKAEKERLEQQIQDGMYAEPPGFFIG